MNHKLRKKKENKLEKQKYPYIAATLNPEILIKFPGPVRVGKKKSGLGRVAGTRQGLPKRSS